MSARAGPLLEQIREDAAATADGRIAAARAEAERLAAEAAAHGSHRRAAAISDRERSLVLALEAARAEATQRVSRETLASRAAALDRIFASAALQIQALVGHPRLEGALGSMLADALTYLPDGPVSVRCAPGVAPCARAALADAGRTGITVREDDTVPLGAMVESADGAIAVDATFVRRLVRERPRLAIALTRQIEARSP